MAKLLGVFRSGDGSVARVRDDDGREHTITLPSPTPTDTEILAAVVADQPRDLAGTTKATIEPSLQAKYEEWQRWKATAAEATARGLSAAVVTALTNKTDAAWADYVATVNAWRLAP